MPAVAWDESFNDRQAGTLGELLDQYFAAKAGLLKATTLASHRRTGALLIDRIGEFTTLDDISKVDFIQMRTWLLAQGYAENTVRKRTKEARVIFQFAVDLDLITSNPCTGRNLPTASKKGKRRDRRIIDDTEIERVLAQVSDPRWQAAIGLAAWAGLRRHEVFKTRAADLDPMRQALLVSLRQDEQ